MSAARIAAVVLAAGASTRMGRNKLLLPVDGLPMARRAAQLAIDAGAAPVVVVVGNEQHAVREALDGLECSFVINPEFTGPTSTSLHAGLRALPDDVDGVVILLADMVHVVASMVRTLINSTRDDASLSVSRYGDVLAPPLLFRRALWPELLAWHGDGCGKAVVKAHQHEATFHDWPIEALRDVDTPDDYRALITPPATR